MVRPSNPKLMARVLEAVTHLGEGKGSLTRDVLDFVKRNSSGPARNLTMQVHRALKHAVNAGLLRCKSGRYKMQIALNPVTHHKHHHHEEVDSYKTVDPLNDMSDEPPIGGTDITRRVQERKKPSKKKRAARKARKRSATRAARRKATKRRTGGMERRVRKSNKRARRKSNNDDAEDWETRKRRMMAKRFEDEEEEDEEEEEEEEEEEDLRDTRKSPKMKSVNEDRYSDVSGDSATVQGRHRSRRSKHMANESRSPSRRGDGDAESHRKSSRRSTRRRSQQRQRDSRQESAPEEADEAPTTGMDEDDGADNDNECMELDEDQGDAERVGTPPEQNGEENE